MVQNGLSNSGTQFLKNEIEYQKNKVRFQISFLQKHVGK